MKKTKRLLATIALAAAVFTPTMAQAEFNWPYTIVDGQAVTKVPQRAEGQTNVLNLTTPKLSVVRVGFVGLGMRGPGAVERWTYIDGTEIKALCDHEKNRAEACNKILERASLPPADIYYGDEGYKQLCERKNGQPSYDADDVVGVFVGDECRGMAHPTDLCRQSL